MRKKHQLYIGCMKEGLGRTLKTKARSHNGISSIMGGEVMGHYKGTLDSGLWTGLKFIK